MIGEIKLLLGDSASNYSDTLINLVIKQTTVEVEDYCKRDLDPALEWAVEQIVKIKLNRMDTEGLSSQSFSGVNENYIDGYPADIQAILNRKRKAKFV